MAVACRILGLVLIAALTADPSPAAARAVASTDLARLAPRLMRIGEVAGMSIAIVRSGTVETVSSFGVTNVATGEAVNSDTVFEAASLSKPIVAYAVLKLADEEKLHLDAPIANYVRAGDLAADPRWRRITVRMLLDHTSGLPNELGQGQVLRIDFDPGSRFSYSGTGYSLLKSAIEEASSLPFETAMARLVFRPLDMGASSFVWRSAYERTKATGHNGANVPTPVRKPLEAKAPSSLHTTAADYAKFLAAVLAGKGLSPASWRLMTSPQTDVDKGCVVCIGRQASEPMKNVGWGLGWAVEMAGPTRYIFHWGENNGDFQAFVIGDPKRRNGAVFLTNSGNGLAIIPALTEAVFPAAHPAFAWMGYDRYDSPARTVQRSILEKGPEWALAMIESNGGPQLTEGQWNRIGYDLLARGRPTDAVRVFAYNVQQFPSSANVYDSLGEAYLAVGNKADALRNYRRSLELDPANDNARHMIEQIEPAPAAQ